VLFVVGGVAGGDGGEVAVVWVVEVAVVVDVDC
jgi:hypothetical protein